MLKRVRFLTQATQNSELCIISVRLRKREREIQFPALPRIACMILWKLLSLLSPSSSSVNGNNNIYKAVMINTDCKDLIFEIMPPM